MTVSPSGFRSQRPAPGSADADIPTRRLRCLVADGESVVRAGLRFIVESEPDLVVTAEAADGEGAVRIAANQRPDVVLMDVRLPGLDGIQATGHIVGAAVEKDGPVPAVIILAGWADGPADEATALECLRAGALGFLLRTSRPDAVVSAIRAAHSGNIVLDPGIALRLTGRGAASDLSAVATARPIGSALGRALRSLSPREREVLAALASGRSNRQLARSLGVQEATVKTHVSRLLTKLGLRSRTEAVALAYQTGVVPSLHGGSGIVDF